MARSLLKTIFFATFFCLSAQTNAGEWKKYQLKSADGISITLDYQINFDYYQSNKSYESYELNPFYINISGVGFKSTDKIRVIFINHMQNMARCGFSEYQWDDVIAADLTRAPQGHFYANMNRNGLQKEQWNDDYTQTVGPITLFSRPYCQQFTTTGQEIAIVRNGKWLTDPISGTHNFKFNLGEGLPY